MEDVNNVVDLTLDSLEKANTMRPVAGSSRKGNNPVLFLVGNSTMRTGTKGNGDNGNGAGDSMPTNTLTPTALPWRTTPWEEPAAAHSTASSGRR